MARFWIPPASRQGMRWSRFFQIGSSRRGFRSRFRCVLIHCRERHRRVSPEWQGSGFRRQAGKVCAGHAFSNRRIAMSALTGVTDANGDFAFPAVRPGQYKVLAWESSGLALMLQGAGLEALKPLDAKSATMKLKSGGRETVQLNWVSSEEKEKAFVVREAAGRDVKEI